MRWFINFMAGRRGADQLSFALIIVFFVLSVLFMFLPTELFFIRIVAYIPLGISVYRMFSKDIFKRQIENDKFMFWWRDISTKINKKINTVKDNKTHKFIKCPKSRQLLRLPRGRGKIRIVCPKCSNTFERKT